MDFESKTILVYLMKATRNNGKPFNLHIHIHTLTLHGNRRKEKFENKESKKGKREYFESVLVASFR